MARLVQLAPEEGRHERDEESDERERGEHRQRGGEKLGADVGRYGEPLHPQRRPVPVLDRFRHEQHRRRRQGKQHEVDDEHEVRPPAGVLGQ
jgi:hypothetical protein